MWRVFVAAVVGGALLGPCSLGAQEPADGAGTEPAFLDLQTEVLEGFAGDYRSRSTGILWRVRVENDTLVIRVDGERIPLAPLAQERFLQVGDTTPFEITFQTDARGNPTEARLLFHTGTWEVLKRLKPAGRDHAVTAT